MPKPNLTKKQKDFVEEYVKTGNATKSAMKVYDTTDYDTAAAIGYENLNKPQIRTLTEHLFDITKTQQVVDNLHSLAISAEDQKIQVEATKVWIDRAIPKSDGSSDVHYHLHQAQQRDKYGL